MEFVFVVFYLGYLAVTLLLPGFIVGLILEKITRRPWMGVVGFAATLYFVGAMLPPPFFYD